MCIYGNGRVVTRCENCDKPRDLPSVACMYSSLHDMLDIWCLAIRRMSESLRPVALAAAERLLEPFARLCVEAGIGAGDLQQSVKRAFVRAAQATASEGHRPNISRIAVLTGLSRMEVKQLLEAQAAPAAAPAARARHRAERVLAGWWTDPDFLNEEGRPRLLALRGGRRSFSALVRRYSGDPRVVTLLDELIRVKAARRLPDGRLEALSRTFATARWDEAGIQSIGERIREHLDTLLHNLKHPSRPLYERVVVNSQLDPKYVPMLFRDLVEQADSLADAMDDALNDPQATVKPGRSAQGASRLGLALYLFEEPTSVEPAGAEAAEPRGRRRPKGKAARE